MITSILKCRVKLLNHSQTFNGSTDEVWKWISNFIHTLLGVWLLIHAEIKVNRDKYIG